MAGGGLTAGIGVDLDFVSDVPFGICSGGTDEAGRLTAAKVAPPVLGGTTIIARVPG